MLVELFRENNNYYDEALGRYGMKLSTDKSYLYVANRHPNTKKLFANTKWANEGWGKSLSRLDKSQGNMVLSITQKTMRGTKVYLGNIITES